MFRSKQQLPQTFNLVLPYQQSNFPIQIAPPHTPTLLPGLPKSIKRLLMLQTLYTNNGSLQDGIQTKLLATSTTFAHQLKALPTFLTYSSACYQHQVTCKRHPLVKMLLQLKRWVSLFP